MPGKLKRPYLLPLHFVPVAPLQIPQYVSRQMDQYLHANRLNKYQSGRYFQPFMKSDAINLQLINDLGPIEYKLVNCKNAALITLNMQQKQRNPYQPTSYIYEISNALSSLPEDIYWATLKTGNVSMISEPIKIAATIENTLLLEYSHYRFKDDIIFAQGYSPSLRIHGMLKMKPPASIDTLWVDQVQDLTLIDSEAYEIWDFIVFGENGGVPDWMIKKLNRILGCSELRIDGKYFTRNEGGKWEEMVDIGYGSLKGYRYELRERINRNSDVTSGDENTNLDLTVMYLTDTKGFGDISDTSNLIQNYNFE